MNSGELDESNAALTRTALFYLRWKGTVEES
jgi:hypothetical protein